MRGTRRRAVAIAIVLSTALATFAWAESVSRGVRAPIGNVYRFSPPDCSSGGSGCISLRQGSDTIVGPVGVMSFTMVEVDGPTEKMTSATLGSDAGVGFKLIDARCASGLPLTCNYTTPVVLTAALEIACTPPSGGAASTTLTVFGDLGGSATAQIFCQGSGGGSNGRITFDVPPPAITFMAPGMATTTATITATGGSDAFTGAQILNDVGNAFTFMDAHCLPSGSRSCSVSAPPALGTTTLGITCTASGSGSNTATLQIAGANGSGDTASATLTCVATGGGVGSGPDIGLGSGTIDVSTAVGATAQGAVNVRDLVMSGPNLLYATQLTGGGTDVFAPVDCVAVGCSIPPLSGSDAHVSFTPVHWGDRTTVLEIDSSNGNNGSAVTLMVPVTGHGSGAELEIAQPSGATSISLGQVPLDTTATATVQLHDNGNVPVTTSVTGVTAPFAASPLLLMPTPGSDTSFVVSCGSSAPTSGVVTDTLHLATPGAYAGSAIDLAVSCQVVDTHIQVAPTMFDFGEVRVGATVAPQTLTITNPTGAAVTLDAIALVRAADGLSLAAPPAGTQLGSGSAVTATLALATTAQTDLDTPAEAIAIDITEGAQHTHLELPVTGKVVLAASTIAPAALDLGTACIGHSVSAQAFLTNTGTATLHVQQPTIDQGFTIALNDPTSYPAGGAALAAGAVASVTLGPTSTAAGTYTGTLSWADDVPSQYTVPVTLAYKADGTAVSPLDLAFGTVAVGLESNAAIVTLENCADGDTTVTVGAVNAVNGTAEAWHVSPSGKQTLSPHGRLIIGVTFAPHYADPYNASLQLLVDGQPTAVRLTGQGTGTAIERTFYGCGCQGSSPAGAAWPLAAAALLVTRRRRRGSSSAR